MRRSLSLVALAGLSASAFADAPRGKIIRIERGGSGSSALRYCDVEATPEIQCFGDVAPARGDLVQVFDDDRKLMDLRVSGVTPMRDGCSVAWRITYEGTPPADSRNLMGIIGVPMASKGHRVKDRGSRIPNGYAQEMLIFGFDHDGDDRSDYAWSFFMCDSSGTPNQNSNNMCISTFTVKSDTDFTRTTTLTHISECLGR